MTAKETTTLTGWKAPEGLDEKLENDIKRIPELGQEGYEHKREQLYLMYADGRSDQFLDFFRREDLTISSATMDIVRMTAKLCGEDYAQSTLMYRSFTLDEVIWRDNGIYAVGTARAKDGKDELVPMEMTFAADWTDEDALDVEYRALISRAQAAGGRLLSVDCRPSTIGMDEGTMDILDDVGFDQEYNEDGSIIFCFEATDYTLEEGTVYQMEMFAQVDEWTAEGEVDEGKGAYQTWIVSFTPEFMDDRTE